MPTFPLDKVPPPSSDSAGEVTSVNGLTGAVVVNTTTLNAATSAQGAKADTAVQPSSLAIVATSGSYTDLTNKPSFNFATTSQGAKADTAVQPSSLSTVATSGSYTDLSNKPPIPAVPSDIGAATAAQGSLASTAVQPAGLTKAAVGLSNVDNTSDVGKPVSTAQQTALDLKAPLNSPSFTGTVSGVSKGAVGLGNVDNTSDINKPISTTTQSALNLLAPLASPTFTGTVSGITKTMVGLPNSDSLPEGSTNQYFTASRVLSTLLTGLSTATSTVVAATDSVLVGIGKLQAQVSLKLAILAAFTNSLTSGTNPSATIDVAVTPSGSSTQVLIGQRTSINYNSSNNMAVGGYLMPGQDVINTAGTGTHDKLVGRYSQMNITGGNVSSAIGFEAAPASIGASTLIGGYAGYYFPNLAGIANISNISSFACFSNDEPRAMLHTAGTIVNADLREIAPSRSAGLVSGRYYSSPLTSAAMTTNAATTNIIYVTYVYIPRRCTPIALGCNVTTGLLGNVILGMYKVQDNQLTTLVAQTSQIATTTSGVKEGTVGVQVDSGVYAIVATFSSACTISWHTVGTNDIIGASSATNYSEQAYISPFTFGALPTTANILPTFAASATEPHLWFRV